MDIKNLKIAVVGAGYGGAAVAKGLSLLGADVSVYEQASQIREVGAGIGLRKDDADLKAKIDHAIADIIKDGTYKKLEKKYFAFDVYGG